MFDLILALKSTCKTQIMLTQTDKLTKTTTATVSSSSTSCYRKCPEAVPSGKRLAKNANGLKWNGDALEQQMPINVFSPNQATLAFLGPKMHRKFKSKSKTKIATLSSGPVSVAGAADYSSSDPEHLKHFETYQTANSKQSKTTHRQMIHSTTSSSTAISRVMMSLKNYESMTKNNTIVGGRAKKKNSNSSLCRMLLPLPTLGTTSFVTLLTIICIETVLLSNMSSCAKTFYMHWNTSNSIFRIDNTDHIIDVNKGNLAFEFDQVHIICPVYEPGAFDNETEKYIIYNVSKVEYETCRITNADPRVIAICDKPQKLMFFTITFRPFTPQPGGLEFLPGNDYYFISTSSKDDLYRRIGGRCSTNNMKVVFKVCCAPEEKNRTTVESTLVGSGSGENSSGSTSNRMENAGVDLDLNSNINTNVHGHGHNSLNTIGISGVNTGFIPAGSGGASPGNQAGQLMPINGMGTSINTNIDQFNRIPLQPNIVGNNIGAVGSGLGTGNVPSSGGIILSPGHGSINMLPPGRGSVGIHTPYPGHHHVQTGIRINNVPTQQNNQHPHYKGNGNANNNNNGKDILRNQSEDSQFYLQEVGKDNGNAILTNIVRYLPPVVETNHSNIVQSTINWLLPAWGSGFGADLNISSSLFSNETYVNNITSNSRNSSTTRVNNYTPTTSHSPPDHGNDKKKNEHQNYDKHPNEVVKNEELTYNSSSGQEARSHFNAYVWILFWLGTWLPGRIEPLVWIAFGLMKTIHNALLICAIGTSHHLSLEAA